MHDHYEQLIHEQGKLLLENASLSMRLHETEERVRTLRAVVADAGIRLDEALDRLRAAVSSER